MRAAGPPDPGLSGAGAGRTRSSSLRAPIWTARSRRRCAARSVLSTGQACQSIERIYVARKLYPAFLDRLVSAAEAVRFNWPDINSGRARPDDLCPARRRLSQASWKTRWRARVRKSSTGGKNRAPMVGGYWIAPTVSPGGDVTHDMAIIREENVRPRPARNAFDSVEEAVPPRQ